jgi:hypothetical protein
MIAEGEAESWEGVKQAAELPAGGGGGVSSPVGGRYECSRPDTCSARQRRRQAGAPFSC